MNLVGQIIIGWDEFPDNFFEKYSEEIARTDAEDSGVVCEINFTYTPPQPGRYDGKPENCYPAEDACVDVDFIQYGIHHQRASAALVRAATGTDPRPARLYLMPQGGLTMATDHLRPFDEQFMATALQFALDWMELNASRVNEILLEHGASVARSAGIENEIDEFFMEDVMDDYSEAQLIGHTADWEASRKAGGNI